MKLVFFFLTFLFFFAAYCGEKISVRLVIATSGERVANEMKGEWIQEAPDRKIFLKKDAPALVFTEFTKIELRKDPFGNDQALFGLNPGDAKKFAEFTKKNAGRQVACFIGEKFFCAPVIHEEIKGGNFVISGNFDKNTKAIFSKMGKTE